MNIPKAVLFRVKHRPWGNEIMEIDEYLAELKESGGYYLTNESKCCKTLSDIDSHGDLTTLEVIREFFKVYMGSEIFLEEVVE